MVFESVIPTAYHMILQFSYIAVFLLNIASSATVFVGIPGLSYAIIFFAITIGMNPLFVGLLSGLGSSIGEIIGYMVGIGGTATIEMYEKKTPKILMRLINFFKNVGFPLIMLAAVLPFPFDVIGIMAGVSKYDIKKFFVATLIGRIVRSLLIAYGLYEIFRFF